jgi:TATA-binding protein-associated factor
VGDLETAAMSYMSAWIELATTPYGSALDASKMFWPVALPRKSHFRAAAKMRAAKLENESYRNIDLESGMGTIPQERIGDASTNSVKIIVGADSEMSVTRTRVVTAKALGIFAAKLQQGSLHYVIDPLWNALSSSSGVQRQVLVVPFGLIRNATFPLPSTLSPSYFDYLSIIHQVASMVLISWLKETKSVDASGIPGSPPNFPSHLKEWLLDLLACPNPAFPTKDSLLPYAELSRTYSKMRSEATQLLHAIESSDMFKDLLATIKVDLESLSADDAINFASKVPTACNDNVGNESLGGNFVDDVESSKQRILTTSGYLKCVQVYLNCNYIFSCAASCLSMCRRRR